MSASVLGKAPIFRGLGEEELRQVAGVAVRRSLPAGETVFAEGDQAQGFYLVLKGKVKVFKLSPDGREQILRTVTPGQQFAEAAAFSGGEYPAFAQALTNCELLFFETERFRKLIAAHPDVAMGMIVAQANLQRHLVQMVEELALKEVGARLAKYLLDLSVRRQRATGQGDVVRLPMKKTELASRLGTVSETLSRTLRKLQEADIIAVKGSQVRVLDRERLVQVAAGLKL
ncbi:MAG: Crp/Fnr family transcriptional regulator [Armatimonadota bacterium]